MRLHDDERGQATVELVAVLPLLMIVALAAWQGVVAGQAMWLAGAAARAAARAEAIGAAPVPAARVALPPRLEQGMRVRGGDDGSVAVTLAIPSVLGDRTLGHASARARFPAQTP